MAGARVGLANRPPFQAIRIVSRPTAVQMTRAGREASGPNRPPVSQSGKPSFAVLRAMAPPKSVPETTAPNR